MSAKMAEGSYRQNQGKTVSLPCFRGRGAHQALRSLAGDPPPELGAVAKTSRYLGARSGMEISDHDEVRHRVRAMRKAWVQAGSVWHQPLPFKLKRLLIIAYLQNSLLAALTVRVLSTQLVAKLDKAIAKLRLL